MTLRQMVYLLDGGKCVNCGAKHRPDATTWQWQVHHCIKQQTLIGHGCLMDLERESQLCVLLCKTCHEGHEQRHHVVPFERLPDRVSIAAGLLGPWALPALKRYHTQVSYRR